MEKQPMSRDATYDMLTNLHDKQELNAKALAEFVVDNLSSSAQQEFYEELTRLLHGCKEDSHARQGTEGNDG